MLAADRDMEGGSATNISSDVPVTIKRYREKHRRNLKIMPKWWLK